MKKLMISTLMVTLCLSPASQAGTSQEVVGARPSAMGGAFVGVADDGNALYWNPAGMAFLNHHEIASMYSDLFGLDIANNYLAYTYPVTGRLAVGLDWFNLGYNDPELEYSFNKFNFGTAYRIGKKASVGVVLKYLNTSTSYDGRSVGKGNGWTGDAGVLYKFSGRLSAGLVLNNLFDGRMTYDNGSKSLLYEMGLRAGVGFKPIKDLLVTADVDDRFHLGSEFVTHELLALRGGLQRDLGQGKETILSFGLGLKYNPLQIDYSFTRYPHLDHTSRISLSAYFNFGRSLVSVEDIGLISGQGLYPALWNSYSVAPVLQFTLRNRSDRPLQCNWEVDLGDIVGEVSSGETVLRAGETKTVYTTAQFSEKFWSNPKDIFAGGEVRASYTRGRNLKSVNRRFQTFVYEKGAIDWNAGVERVASFVNPQDPELREIATRFIELNADGISENSSTANIQYAIAVFNGLKSTGLKYLADPNNPYEKARTSPGFIDNIQYPVELLNSRLGDCDDLTALFCALLETVGIQTMAIDVPGHLFMMFDTGVPVVYDLSLMLPDNLLVKYDDRVFIPVEVTAVQSSFTEAWSVAASTYIRWDNLGDLHLVDFREAWLSYPPAPLAGTVSSPEFDPTGCIAGTLEDRSALDQYHEEFLAANYYGQMDSLSSDPEILNRAAVRQIFRGNTADGKDLLLKAYSLDPEGVDVRLNLANVYSLENSFDSAFAIYGAVGPSANADGYCRNMVAAKCLSVDRAYHEIAGDIVTFLDNLREECGNLAGSPVDSQMIGRCLAGTETGLDLAECVGRLVIPPALETTKREAAGLPGSGEIPNPKVRLFRWYY